MAPNGHAIANSQSMFDDEVEDRQRLRREAGCRRHRHRRRDRSQEPRPDRLRRPAPALGRRALLRLDRRQPRRLLTAWLHDELHSAGLPAVCIETRHANAAMKTMPNKTDRNDARALAQIMRTGWYRQVHVKSRQCRLWRSLLVARRTVLNEMRSIENVVRAVLREGGLKLGTPSRAAFAERVRDLMAEDASVKPLVDPLLTILVTMLDQFARLTKQVLDIVRREKVCRRLMSVPGVGPITALAFRATIDRPDRFRRSRDVGAHLGLTPSRYQSGETDVSGRISRCGDELARTALYEAAHTLLVRSRKWSSLRAWGMRVAKTRGMA